MKSFLFLLIFVLTSCAHLTSSKNTKLSILQGVTNSKEVEFSVVALKERILRFELRSAEDDVLNPEEVRIVSRDFSKYSVHKFFFIKDPLKDYNLYVYEDEKIVDQRLIGRGQRENSKLKLAVASCMDDYYPGGFKIWDVLAQKNPEYLLLIGDNVYADKPSFSTTQVTDPEVLWQRYIDIRFKLPLYFQSKLIPVHALWDDHDYGRNNANDEYPHRLASKEIFEAFWAQDLTEENWSKGFGVGGMLNLGDFNLYFLDARSFRSPNKDGKQLGLDQEAWLFSKIKDEASPSFIIQGDQFFGGYHPYESFEGNHPNDFSYFVSELKKISTPFVFLSGDRHMSEIMQFPRSLFGKPSFEITSSPMHGKADFHNDVNPWRVVATKGRTNFTMIDSVAKDDHWFMDVENIGENGDLYYRRELAVFIKDLQNNLNEVRKRRYGKRRYRKARPRRNKRR